ncbi:PRAME family member 18 [Cricetulus griseus]|uniref:PRAME family member 18 n=1 Tax=Cricetulus griseus TaxID=10029 RepID=G3I122_CRIGR|nr:PRAME family member 18 [Cricetulus griseus]
MRSLLKDEALVVSALKEVPMELFPTLLKSTFMANRHPDSDGGILALQQCLPVGALMKIPDLVILKAVMGGLDLLIKQNDRPRNCKLEVLDLWDAQHNFWNAWAGIEDHVCSPDVVSETQPVSSTSRNAARETDRYTADIKIEGLYVLMDFQIGVPLPALSQCSQLVEVNFVKNFLTVSSLKKLLQHTANLRHLAQEVHPAPEEICDGIGKCHARHICPTLFSSHGNTTGYKRAKRGLLCESDV